MTGRVLLFCLFGSFCLPPSASPAQSDRQKASPPACVCDPHPPTWNQLFDGKPAHQSWIRKHPDQFSWIVLLHISRKAPESLQTWVDVTEDGQTTQKRSRNVEWETWADDDFTFPTNPTLDPPKWQNRQQDNEKVKHLHLDPLQAQLGQNPHPDDEMRVVHKNIFRVDADGIKPNGNEEVRRNFKSFHTIMKNSLWYTNGIAAYAKSGKVIPFPRRAIEIKAVWAKTGKADRAKAKTPSHLNYAKNGLYRLVGLHIMTKALPEWTWATFEWAGNLGRCDYIGCRDSFGQTADTPAKYPIDQEYSPEKMCPQLTALMRAASQGKPYLHGKPQQPFDMAEWSGYRLKGSQTLSATGRQPLPERLGNSAIENTDVPTSSCLGCHLRARVNKADGSHGSDVGFNPDGTGPLNFPSDAVVLQEKPGSYQTHFIWAFINASPLPKPPSPPPQPAHPSQ